MIRFCLPLILAMGVLRCADAVRPAGVKPIQVASHGAGEGPAWNPVTGELYFTGQEGIAKLNRNGQVSVVRSPAGPNGLLFDPQNRLVICEADKRRVTRMSTDGKTEVLTSDYGGKRYNSPNDLTMDSKGRIYFSDPRYGPRDGMEIQDAAGRAIEGVYRIDTNGKVTRIITHEVDRPNGLLVSPDDKYLYVADNNNNTRQGARRLYRFNLKPDGGIDPATRKLLHDWGDGRGPDGLKMDTKGRLFVAGGLNQPHPPFEPSTRVPGGVYVFSPEGEQLDFLPVPVDQVTNCAFGGPGMKTLFITAGGTLWSMPVLTPGRAAFERSR